MSAPDQTPQGALSLEALHIDKRFGPVHALDDVSMKVPAGSFHALLGENGAGKSTLVKCVMGFYTADSGQVMVGGREQAIDSPRAAHALGLGMVYQHFTLVPNMTVAENLVLSRAHVPAVIDWRARSLSQDHALPHPARHPRACAGGGRKAEGRDPEAA